MPQFSGVGGEKKGMGKGRVSQGGHLKSSIGNYLLDQAILKKEAMPSAIASKKNETKQNRQTTTLFVFCQSLRCRLALGNITK